MKGVFMADTHRCSVPSIILCLILGAVGGVLIYAALLGLLAWYYSAASGSATSTIISILGLGSFLLPTMWSMALGWMFRRIPAWVIPMGLSVPPAVVAWLRFSDEIPMASCFLLLLAGAMYALGLPGAYYAILKFRPACEPKCPHCGYNLYYAVSMRCPECGRPFTLKEVDLRLAQWDGSVLRPPSDPTSPS